MTIPPPRAHDPHRDAEAGPPQEFPRAPDQCPPQGPPLRYPVTSAYLALMVTLIFLAVLFEWRI